jgi:hypothetical protein
MDIVEEIKEILARQNPHQKENGLEKMNDVFEYGLGYNLNEEDMTAVVKLLLAAALQEKDPKMKEWLLRTLYKATVWRRGKYLETRIDWDPLAASLSTLDKWQLVYVINTLSFTGREKYVSLLNEYTHHADPDINTRALKAIKEIKAMVARAAQRAQQENKGDVISE